MENFLILREEVVAVEMMEVVTVEMMEVEVVAVEMMEVEVKALEMMEVDVEALEMMEVDVGVEIVEVEVVAVELMEVGVGVVIVMGKYPIDHPKSSPIDHPKSSYSIKTRTRLEVEPEPEVEWATAVCLVIFAVVGVVVVVIAPILFPKRIQRNVGQAKPQYNSLSDQYRAIVYKTIRSLSLYTYIEYTHAASLTNPNRVTMKMTMMRNNTYPNTSHALQPC